MLSMGQTNQCLLLKAIILRAGPGCVRRINHQKDYCGAEGRCLIKLESDYCSDLGWGQDSIMTY